tara:strand:- start:3206 stop:3358 length:153 start_codon:yes stop_codon:yes gene_type:complete
MTFNETEIFEAVCIAVGDDGRKAQEVITILHQERETPEQWKGVVLKLKDK